MLQPVGSERPPEQDFFDASVISRHALMLGTAA
jgi:hypothetical protein